MEENSEIFCLVLLNGTILVSRVEELYADIGKPDCKLDKPFVIQQIVNGVIYLNKWIDDLTEDEEILISSDKILTIVSPKSEILNKYLECIK